uniref:Putative secreted protein n=1 Tax=Ixodes ricinus TaxID=34613 RepID=A0A6B0UGC9_IXORI
MVSPHFLFCTVICISTGGRGITLQLHGRFQVCVVTLRHLAHPPAFDLGSSTQLCNLTALLMCSPAPPPRFLGAAGRCSTRTPVCRAPSLRVGRPWVGS